MASTAKALEPAFQGVGQRVGTEIWRIENFQPVPLQKSDYGKFYSGDSYVVLQITTGKGGAYLYDIHFWQGKDTTQVYMQRLSMQSEDTIQPQYEVSQENNIQPPNEPSQENQDSQTDDRLSIEPDGDR